MRKLLILVVFFILGCAEKEVPKEPGCIPIYFGWGGVALSCPGKDFNPPKPPPTNDVIPQPDW